MDHVLVVIQGLVDKIPMDGGVIMLLAGILEFVLRMVKTEKPKSIMYFIADMFRVIGAGLSKVALFLDKILPQRLA